MTDIMLGIVDVLYSTLLTICRSVVYVSNGSYASSTNQPEGVTTVQDAHTKAQQYNKSLCYTLCILLKLVQIT